MTGLLPTTSHLFNSHQTGYDRALDESAPKSQAERPLIISRLLHPRCGVIFEQLLAAQS
jgi:hypothetical protein